MLASCTQINDTYCSLNSFITDFDSGYKVRVQLVAGGDESIWVRKKFLLNESKHNLLCYF